MAPDRNPSAGRIAISLGVAVAVVMLAIWGASSLAAAFSGGLKPVPPTRIASRIATPAAASAATKTTSAEVRDIQPKPAPSKPVTKPDTAPKATAPPKATTKSTGTYVVVIDPGHGGELPGTEPEGPASSTPKNKTNFGATSIVDKSQTEARIALAVGLKLRPLLEAQGVKVIMTRTAPKAISNKDRAAIANEAHADLFLRLHCDGVDGSSGTNGISMQVPGDSREWAPIGSSRKAGEIILSALIRETGATNRGIAPRKDLVGFNWSKVTTCLPELGFLSNRAEAEKLASSSYQSKLAQALADGTMTYLRTLR